jgi:hypothetical protein
MKPESFSRYMLFGTRGAWDDYIVHSDDEVALRLEAVKRLQDGYTASLVDKTKNTQIDLSLKKT